MTDRKKPLIGLVLGDAAGIGPELSVKLLADPSTLECARVVVIGDPRHWEAGIRTSGAVPPMPRVISDPEDLQNSEEPFLLLDFSTVDPSGIEAGKVSPKAGKAVLDTLLFSMKLICEKRIDGFVFAPLNKEAMHRGGSPYGSELELFKELIPGNKALEEINILDEAWTMRATSHVALKDVPSLLSVDGVYDAIRFIHAAMTSYGTVRPKLAVAALNPHNGEHGLFGDEEGRIIEPAVKRAKTEGIPVEGPFPSDTVFIKLRDGIFDAVVAMYHDQCQIATKLMGFHRGVTFHAGFPVPITTPAHGTAFDIAGKGIADPGATKHAFEIACRIAAKALG